MWELGSPCLVPVDHWPQLSAAGIPVQVLFTCLPGQRHRVSVAEGLCLLRARWA